MNASPIHQNRAASTHALSATEPSALQLEVISQDVNERNVRVGCDGASYTVDIKFDGPGQGSKLPRPVALASAGTSYTYSIMGLQASIPGSLKLNCRAAFLSADLQENRGQTGRSSWISIFSAISIASSRCQMANRTARRAPCADRCALPRAPQGVGGELVRVKASARNPLGNEPR